MGRIVATVGLSSLVLTVLFGVWTVWGIRAVRRTLVEEVRHDALALLESLVLASQYSVATGALVDQLETEAQAARVLLVAGLIDPDRLSANAMPDLLERSESGGISVWVNQHPPLSYPPDIEGLVRADSSVANYDWGSEPAGAIGLTLADSLEDIAWVGTGIPTGWGGVVLWEQAEEDFPPPSYGGIGELIQQIASKSKINYIMLQSPEGIVFASRPLTPVLRLAADSFLVATLEANQSGTREITFEDQPVLEAAAPFLSVDLPSGMFRVGVSLAGVQAARDRLTLQLGLTAALFLLLSSAVIAFIVSRRSLSDLGRSYRRVETMTSRILDSIDQGVVAIDGSGDVTVFNPAAERIAGRAADDVIGRPVAEAIGEIDYELRPVSTSGAAVRGRELRLRSEEGLRELVYTTTPMAGPDGVAEGAVAVVRDETEGRALAERVRRAERLSEMGHLAAGVAHEIRNPLNAIALAAQRLRLEVQDAEAAQLATTVWEESKRLNAIIEDYLSFARSSNQPPVDVDLNNLISGLGEIVRLEAQKAGVEFEIHPTTEPLVVRGVGDELKKALWNVLANALAATPAGGRVAIRLGRDGDRLLLWVDDTGRGIPPENLPQVFEPYFTTTSGGTGLGLAITHRIVTDHGGSIDVASPVPESTGGTRVTIALPIADERDEDAGGLSGDSGDEG
ncbi:MAG TPA: ATP-binding protein [Acidobacteriota bacterium]|nr:ATP-binding protein [Acidobacteriota bacterium]